MGGHRIGLVQQVVGRIEGDLDLGGGALAAVGIIGVGGHRPQAAVQEADSKSHCKSGRRARRHAIPFLLVTNPK